MKIYKSFDEIADEIQKSTPKTIYKYRTWGIDTHEKTIKDLELWFAHPHSLNDPYDVRPPYNFIVDKIDIKIVKQKIKDAGREIDPDLTEKELNKEVEVKLKSLLEDPIGYFKKNRGEYILEKSNYDKIGILSFCLTDNNEAMWAYYGNNHSGFAVGFKTVELAKTIDSIAGYVDYNDAPINYYIMADNQGSIEAEIFRKSNKWRTEQELRFATAGIGIYKQRTIKFPFEAVEEIVLGISTSKETADKIIEETSKTLPNIPIYKLQIKTDSFGFNKIRIK